MASKILILTRHAKARERDFVTKDIERPIRAKGVHQALSIGLQLKGLGIVPDIVISSPSLRTLETARYINSQLSKPCEIAIEDELYDAFKHQIIDSIHMLNPKNNIVLYALHNPSITELVYDLDRSEERISHLRCGETIIVELGHDWKDFNIAQDYPMKHLKP